MGWEDLIGKAVAAGAGYAAHRAASRHVDLNRLTPAGKREAERRERMKAFVNSQHAAASRGEFDNAASHRYIARQEQMRRVEQAKAALAERREYRHLRSTNQMVGMPDRSPLFSREEREAIAALRQEREERKRLADELRKERHEQRKQGAGKSSIRRFFEGYLKGRGPDGEDPGTMTPERGKTLSMGQRAAQAGQSLASFNRNMTGAKGAIGAVGIFAVATIGSAKAAERFASGVLAGQEHLAMWSGGISRSFAMLRRQEWQLSRQQAVGTEASTKALAQEMMKFRKEFQPLKTAMQNLTNRAAQAALVAGRIAMFPANGWRQFFQFITGGGLDPHPGAPTPSLHNGFTDWLDDVSSGRFAEPRNKRPGEP
jgi:hypothetical protein